MPKADKINLILVDDHPAVIAGLQHFLEAKTAVQVTQTFGDGKALVENLDVAAADMLILDINIPGYNGIQCLEKVRQQKAELCVIIYSTTAHKSVLISCLKQNVNAYVLKDDPAEDLLSAVEQVMAGKTFYSRGIRDTMLEMARKQMELSDTKLLSAREDELLNYFARGWSSSKIAETLFISHYTVETHKKNIMLKLNIKNAAELVRYATDTRKIS